MCDDALRKISNKSASQQDSTSSDAVATLTINNFAYLKLAMSEMTSSFKTELLTHVNESISQVYQDFELRTKLSVFLKLNHCLRKAGTVSLGK